VSDWLELNLCGMRRALASFARSAGAQVVEREGVFAAVNPAVPERSVFNSVVYTDPRALAEAHAELARTYADAGCAWTVWVPEADAASAALLQGAGHTLDAQPRAMGIELAESAEPDLSSLDWTAQGDLEQMAALNDAAYGYAPGTWMKAIGRDVPGLWVYLARVEGLPAATVCALDADDDCTIWNVATADWARGRGLCGSLMHRALFDAAQRGCGSSTLQATKLGAPIYRRCGYRDLGALAMWEFQPAELRGSAVPAPPA